MPTPQDIWKMLPEGQYDEILSLIKENNELLNIDDEDSSLFQYLLSGSHLGAESQNLREYMIQHPKLHWGNINDEPNNSNTFSLIRSARIDMLLLAVKNPTMLLGEDKLAYAVANDVIASTQKSLQMAEKRNPNSPTAKQLSQRMKELPSVVELLRDVTVLHALKTDDAELLTRLEQAGWDCTAPLGKHGGEKKLKDLTTADTININVWYDLRAKARVQSFINNPNSLFARSERAKAFEEKKASMEQKYLKDKVELIREGLNGDSQQLEEVVAQTKPGIASK